MHEPNPGHDSTLTPCYHLETSGQKEQHTTLCLPRVVLDPRNRRSVDLYTKSSAGYAHILARACNVFCQPLLTMYVNRTFMSRLYKTSDALFISWFTSYMLSIYTAPPSKKYLPTHVYLRKCYASAFNNSAFMQHLSMALGYGSVVVLVCEA